MFGYVMRRLILAVPTLWGATLLVFILLRVAPGDVAEAMLAGEGGGTARPEELAKIRAQFGLDKPIHIQYLVWMKGLVTLDFGDSFWLRVPTIDLFKRKVGISSEIGLLVMLVSAVLAIPFGIMSALFQDKWPDYVFRTIAFAFNSMPSFWVGLMILLFLIRMFNWIPEQGAISFFDRPLANLGQVIWPVMVVGLSSASTPLRMMRSTMLEVLREDYIRTAKSKGLTERVVIVRHAMRNALIPVVTLYGLQIPITIGGLVVTEQVFGIPGIGLLMVGSITNKDFPVTQPIVAMVAATVVMSNLLVDLTYGWLDPRIRY